MLLPLVRNDIKSFLTRQSVPIFLYLYSFNIYKIGMTRFELATPATRTRCATKLRHIPTLNFIGRSLVKLLNGSVKPSVFRSPAPFKKVINLFSRATLPHPDIILNFQNSGKIPITRIISQHN